MGELLECPAVQLLDEDDFDAQGDWILGNQASIAGGQLILDWLMFQSQPYASQFPNCIKNSVYRVEYKVDLVDPSGLISHRCTLGTQPLRSETLFQTTAGTFEGFLLAREDNPMFRITGAQFDRDGLIKVDYCRLWNFGQDIMCRGDFLDQGLTFGNMWWLSATKVMVQLVNEATSTNILFVVEL